MKVAVTGGAGFIGRAVMTQLEAENHDAWMCDREHGCDITGDLEQLQGADAVIHLAGVLGTHELFDTIDEAIRVNINGSLNVMNWCLATDAQYVGILMPDVFPSIYTATKVASKKIGDALYHSKGLRVSHVRAFNAYGAGQKHGSGHPQKILPTFATEAWARHPLPIWGSGEQSVDLVHTDDLARMLVCALDYTDNQVFDGGTGHKVTVNQLATFVNLATANHAGVVHLPMRRGEIETQIVAEGEGWNELGWKPVFEAGKLLETIYWYQPSSLGRPPAWLNLP